MKKRVNLVISGNSLDGYLNIGPIVNTNTINIEVLDGEAIEIVALDVVDHFEVDQVKEFISYLHKKLRPNGVLKVSGRDVIFIGHEMGAGRLGEGVCNKLLYGSPLHGYRSFTSPEQMELYLKDAGFIIVKKSYNREIYTFEAKKK